MGNKINAADILKIVSDMRHGFLNHLQVVSGYLQLGKKEMAVDYIQDITRDLCKLSPVVHLRMPEMAAVFLWGEELARSMGVETIYCVRDDLSHCAVPGPEAGGLLRKILRLVFNNINDGRSGEKGCLRVTIHGCDGGDGGCTCTLGFNPVPEMDNLLKGVEGINSMLANYGGRLNGTQTAGSGEYRLEMVLPCSKSK